MICQMPFTAASFFKNDDQLIKRLKKDFNQTLTLKYAAGGVSKNTAIISGNYMRENTWLNTISIVNSYRCVAGETHI